MADEFFMGIGFYMGREGRELYTKNMERLDLYVTTQFREGHKIDTKTMERFGLYVTTQF